MPVSQMPFPTGNAPALLCIGFRSYISAIGYQSQHYAQHKALSNAYPGQLRKQNWISGSVRCNQASYYDASQVKSTNWRSGNLGSVSKQLNKMLTDTPAVKKVKTSPTSHFRDIIWRKKRYSQNWKYFQVGLITASPQAILTKQRFVFVGLY